MVDPRRINLDEQARVGSCTTAILADDAVTNAKIASGAVDSSSLALGSIDQTHINLTGDLSFNNNQALDFRVENLASDPAAGNPGRLIWRTDINELKIDNGSAFVSISAGAGGGHTIEDEGSALPQRAALNFVGTGVTVTDTGSKTEVSIPGSGVTFTKDIFTVVDPSSKIFTLSIAPTANSEIVALNGLIFKPGASNDYTISGNQVTLNAGVTLTVGDELLVVYAS